VSLYLKLAIKTQLYIYTKTAFMNRTTLTGHHSTGVQLSITAVLRFTRDINWIQWRVLQCLLNNCFQRIVIVTTKVPTNIRYPFPFEQYYVLFSSYIKTCQLHSEREFGTEICYSIEAIQLSSHRCFVPLPTALFDYVMCLFRAQNNKSSDLYLLVMARCNWRTRSSI